MGTFHSFSDCDSRPGVLKLDLVDSSGVYHTINIFHHIEDHYFSPLMFKIFTELKENLTNKKGGKK